MEQSQTLSKELSPQSRGDDGRSVKPEIEFNLNELIEIFGPKRRQRRRGDRVLLNECVDDEAPLRQNDDTELYTYEELLKRAQMLDMNNKTMLKTNDTDKLIIPVPLVTKSGRCRTTFVNFLDAVHQLHRPVQHLLSYMIAELGTSCSVCSTNQLWIKGNFKNHHIEKLLRNYAKTYVLCPACQSPHTLLKKNNRLLYMFCDICGAKSSVPIIKTGFRARVQMH